MLLNASICYKVSFISKHYTGCNVKLEGIEIKELSSYICIVDCKNMVNAEIECLNCDSKNNLNFFKKSTHL